MFKTKNIYFLIFLISSIGYSQINTPAFKEGEFLKYKINYGLLSAGFMSLQLNSVTKDNKDLFHVNGKGWTTGFTDMIFSVEDNYQTYFDKKTMRPHHFIRNINEGGHIKNKEIFFDFNKHYAQVIDHKRNTEESFFIQNNINDMLSSLYYLRNLNLDDTKPNDIITIHMFYDDQVNRIQLKFIERTVIKTMFGNVKTIKLKPMVEIGRIFDESESLTMWITDDKNKIPVKIKASVLVGSIKAELIEYKGLANSFPIIFN